MRQITSQWRLVTIAATLIVGLMSAGCDPVTSISRSSGEPPTPVVSPVVASKTLYQSDWSARASEWPATPHWQVRDGALVNDGGGATPIAVPYHPAVENYTIEIVMTVEQIRGESACANSYGLEGLNDSGQPVYFTTVACVDKQRHGFSYLYPANASGDSSGTHTYDYTTGSSPHTYYIVVRGKYVTFNLNDSSLGTISCDNMTKTSRLLLLDSHIGLSVQSIKITTP
jgi:hypothetical protein